MDKKLKISSTAYRVLLLMLLLNEKEYSIDELNKIFSNDPNIARTFTREVILKYLSTLRLAGYEIAKPSTNNNYKYRLLNSPVKINITAEEIKTMVYLDKFTSDLSQNRLINNYSKFLKIITRYLPEEQKNLLSKEMKLNKKSSKSSNFSKYSQLIKKIEQFINEERRIIINLKLPIENTTQILLEPNNIKYSEQDVFACGFNPLTGERQQIDLKNIQDIKQLPTKSKYNKVLSPIVFKIKGRLAKGYRPYEGEKISEFNPEMAEMTVTSYEDKNILMQRLLKYGDHCEILYPKSIRENMIKILKETLSNYE